MLQLIDDQTASNYYNEIDTATGDDLQTKTVALEAWANNKKAERTRQEWDHVSKVFTDFDNYSAAEGLNDFDEESRYQYANRKFIANQTGDTPENQMFVYPSKRDEVTDKMFGKTGLSEKETFDLFKNSIESRNASEEALRELPGVLAQGVLKRAGEGKPFDEVDSWFAFSDWKERHADKLASMPKGWETAMLDSAVKLHTRTEQLMDDVAPESKRAMDTLMKFTRPEDAANLPEADRADVANLAKDFSKLTPEQRDGIYATLSYAAEANGAGMGKGFWEKVGEGMARGGGNIYDDAAMTLQDRQARQNIAFFQDLIDKPQAEPLGQKKNTEVRPDGTAKGAGFLGARPRIDNPDDVSTEISIGVDWGSGEKLIPTMVPSLDDTELNYLLSTPSDKLNTANPELNKSITQKAVEFAKERESQGLPFFAQPDESPKETLSLDFNPTPDRMQTADSIQMQRDMAQKGLEENKQRLGELRVMREIRDLAQGRIDPIKTEMDGVLGQVVQGAYDFSQSAAYTGMAMVPYVGLPAVMGALANSNYLRMLDQYPDMDADAAFDLSLAIAGPQAIAERFQAGLLLGKLPFLGKAMKKLTDARVPLPARIGLGYGAVVGLETGTELVQEAMPIVADQLASAVREDMPEFDAGKAWGEYRDQAPKIFYSMLWGGLMGGGAVGIRELERSGVYMRNLQELEMHGITGEAAQNIAAEQDQDAATTLYREAWDKRSQEDIQAGIAKRAAMLDAAQATQANPDFPTRRIEENPNGTLTHIIEQNGQAIYSTNDPAAADIALIKLTRRVVSNDLRSDRFIVSEVLDQWNSEDPTNVAVESDGITAQQKLEKLQAAGNVAQIEELHRRIATSEYRNTPYDEINILGEATVEDLGEMVFRGVVTFNKNTRPEDAREEIHHVAVRKALMKGSVAIDTLRGWLDATETALPDKFPGLIRENENDIVESFARVQRAYEDGTINAEEETRLPASFVDYIKRMLKAFKEVLQRAVALRSAFKDGILPAGYETFLADSVGLNQQARVDTARERVSNEVLTDTNYSIGTNPFPVETKGKWWANEDFEQRGGRISTMSPDQFLSQVRPLEVDDASRDNIDDLKNMMQSGRKLDPLAIYADGKEDGRHRAIAAKELGMDTLPVIDFRANKPEPKGNDFSIGSRASAVSTDTPSIRAGNATITGPANYSIGAFHGTPHKVDKFTTERIGTGEGAQAYGWGLYFAENKKVAEDYQRTLAKRENGKNGWSLRPIDSASAKYKDAINYADAAPRAITQTISGLNATEADAPRIARELAAAARKPEYIKAYNDIADMIESGEIVVSIPAGNFYTVDLDVEPEDLLDWDKPLSEQSPQVKAALEPILSKLGSSRYQIENRPASAFYSGLASTERGAFYSLKSPKAASEALLAAGIPGIRYLDEGSRGQKAEVRFDTGLKRWLVEWDEGFGTRKILSSHQSEKEAKIAANNERTYNYVAFDQNLIKITEENGNRIAAADALAAPALSATNYSIGTMPFKGWFGDWENDPQTSSKVVDQDGKPQIVFHGTQRPDRVGDRFRKSRATSGPMAYFTSDPEVASSYATGKMDTSMEMPSDYAGWFKWKGKGMRSPVNIDQAWWNLSQEERATIKDRIYTVGYADHEEATGDIVSDSQSIMSRDSIDYELRQAKGNALRALVDMWLSSGTLYNQEDKFLEVLQAAGVKGATLDDPNSVRSAVYPVYLDIKKPLDTADIPNDVISALEQAGKRKRAKQSAGKNADSWDKNTISGNEWMSALKEDMAKGTTHAWTRIPDWVTETLSTFGYDGIKDTGGKHGGVQHQVWIPFSETQVKSATGNRGTFDPTSPNINYSIGLSRNSISQVSDKDDPFRVGTAKLGTSKVPKNTPQDSNISGDNVPDDLLAKQMEKMNYAHLPKNILSEKDPKKKRRKLINWFKKNLLALHDAFPEEFRARATHWYDGANRIAKEMGSQFKASTEQASGVIAVFSPQKDWFMNVAQAEQFMELWTNSQDVVLEESLVRAEIEGIIEAATAPDKQKRKKVTGETKEQTAERREYNKALDERAKVDRRKKVEQVIGKTIRQLDAEPDLQGWAIRVLAQITFGRNYRNLSPEGDRLGMAANDDGALAKNGWGSINEIEKAVRIMKDGSLKNISDNLGNEHKVRNFYNNIAAPNTPYGDATIDTHAVAAAHLMPYGAKATEVGHNFGSGMNGSEVLGISGVYHLYLDAYREAAADRGILPRQMQSITWEAIRLVYPAATKNATTLAKSQKTWKDLNDDSARNTLVGGRIPSPVWAGANDNRESQSNPTGLGENIGQEGVSGGSLLSGVRPAGAGRDGGVNYSIASQSEIDRVNRALGGMNRGPDERLKVYERAKQKFSKLMAWNSDELAAMADTGSDDSQIRRTQILQALGELDGILSVLPPEVRGRVGGYTKLAGIAPMDVLKDGEKVSEVSGMNGAIISAWMREGQNIGQAGKQVSLPPGYTATENLSSKRADKAIADFFRDRIKKIDSELEKVLVREYTEAITKAVKQSRPKAGDNGVRKSTLGAETQKFADTVLRATLLDDEATAKRMTEIEAALNAPDTTTEDISNLSEEWSILNTFGDLDNRSSETLAQGLDWLKGQLKMGREAWRIKEQARIDEQRARARQTIEWLGKGTAKKRFSDKGLMQRIAEVGNNYLLDHASFEQFVGAFLPPEIAANFSERLRKGDMAAQAAEIRDGKGILDAVRSGAKAANMSAGDAMIWLKADQKNAVAYLEGRKVKDERIAIELAQKIVTGEADRSNLTDTDVETLRNELAALPADAQKEFVTIKRVIFRGEDVKLDMSRAKAMQLLLSWNQPDVQNKMRKEGWTDESAADLKALVNDPVSREVMAYAKELYGKGAGIVNPVYSRMFGMNMPQVKNYAPTRFLNAKDSKDIGLDGSPTATGTTPGFAKSRVTHSAKIAPEDALTVMQGHIAQQAHWVHFAELAREFRAILSNPEVRESLKQTHGDGVLKSAELWADQLEQRGGNKARESAWLNPILGTVLSGKAVSSLGFSLKTLAMQLDNTIRFGLALDMKQIVSALSNPSAIVEDIQTVWDSPAIQNRLEGGATAEARFLFSRYAGKPNFAAKIAEASMTPINWLDSAATSISSAIVYRANLNDALAAGMPENLAKQTALDAASKAIYQFAQPVSFGQKSIVENNGNVMAKMFFLFMSDARLKTAILADAARGLATGSGDKGTHIRRILAIETMAVLSHVVSNAFRDAFSDDDDEEIWTGGGIAKAILLAPLQGFFFAGTLGELAISKLTGQKTFNSTTQNPLLSAMEQGVRAGNNLEDAFDLDDPDAMFKEWNNIFRSMALSPAMAAPAVLLNMVKPVVGLYQNATTED